MRVTAVWGIAVFAAVVHAVPKVTQDATVVHLLVTTEAGSPIGDAKVIVTAPGISPLTGSTDAKGLFEAVVPDGRMGDLGFVVAVEGYRIWSRRLTNPDDTLTAVMTKANGVLSGSVVDAETGDAISDAVVSALHSTIDGFTITESDEERFESLGEVQTRTDERGRFLISALSPGKYRLQVVADGYRRYVTHQLAEANPTEAVFFLFRGAVVSGSVTDGRGHPISGASILSTSRRAHIDLVATTGDDGTYTFSALGPGEYDFLVLHKQFAPRVLPNVSLDERMERLSINMTLETGAQVKGQLLAVNSRPTSGQVEITVLDGFSLPDRFRIPLSMLVPATGSFQFASLPPGYHEARITAPGHLPRTVEFAVGDKQDEVQLGEIELESGRTIRGRVTSLDDVPIPNATVRAQAYGRTSHSEHHAKSVNATATTDTDGSFLLAGLGEGRFVITAKAVGYGTAQLDDVGSDETISIRLEPSGRIQGTVVDSSGVVVPVFEASCRRNSKTPSFGYIAVVDPNGAFSITDLSAGVYVIGIDAGDAGGATLSGIVVQSGEATDIGTVKLGPVGSLRGNVVDTLSSPVSGAIVTATSPGGRSRTSTTGNNGFFTILGVDEGTTIVSASHHLYADGDATVEVHANSVTETTLVLESGTTITGLLINRDGRGVSGRTVTASPEESQSNISTATSAQKVAVTDSEGRFRLEQIRSGRAVVNVFSPSLPNAPILSREIVVGRDPIELTLVAAQVRWQGQLSHRGIPTPNVIISLTPTTEQGHSVLLPRFVSAVNPQDVGDNSSYSAVTDDSGRFEVLIDRPGGHMISAEAMDGSFRGASRWIQIPDEPIFSLDLEYADVEVVGRVLDATTKLPIKGARVLSAVTDADGRFSFDKEPGEHRVVFSASGYQSQTVDFRVGAEPPPELVVALLPGRSISGRVVSANGSGVAHVRLTATPAGTHTGDGAFASTLRDGTFQLTGLADQTYVLFAASQTYGFAIRNGVRPSESPSLLMLEPGVPTELVLVDESNTPLGGAKVVLAGVGGVRVPGLVHGVADDRGAIRISLPSNRLDFVIRIEEHQEQTATVDIFSGQPTMSFVLQLRRH